MSDDELREKLASDYAEKMFELNPNSFTVSTYCNSEVFEAAFEEGWIAARATDKERDELRAKLAKTKAALEMYTGQSVWIEPLGDVFVADEALAELEKEEKHD